MRRRQGNNGWIAVSRVLMDPKLQYVLIIASALGFAALLFSGFLLFRYNDANDLLRRGKQQMAEGKVALAAQTFQQLVRKDGDHYEGHIRLGQAYLELGEKREAEQEFRLATLLKTEASGGSLRGRMDDVLAAIAMSKLSVARGKYEEAETRLRAFLKTKSKNARLREALFELYASWGTQLQQDETQWPAAIAQYKKALPFATNYPLEAQVKDRLVTIAQQQANILLAKDPKSEVALSLLKDTLRYQYSVDMLIRLADLCERQGDLSEALQWTKKAYNANPENTSLKYTDLLIREGRHLVDQGYPDKARAYFEEAEHIGHQANMGLDQLYPVEASRMSVLPTRPDWETEEFTPEIRFTLINKADKDLEFLLVKAVFYSGDKVLASVVEPVIEPGEPLLASGAKAHKSQRKVVLKTDLPLRLEQLTHGLLTVRLYVAYSEGDSKTWQLKALKETHIRLPKPPKPKELEVESTQSLPPEGITLDALRRHRKPPGIIEITPVEEPVPTGERPSVGSTENTFVPERHSPEVAVPAGSSVRRRREVAVPEPSAPTPTRAPARRSTGSTNSSAPVPPVPGSSN